MKRKIVASMFVTLDGVMQAPGGPDEDREGGFAHGGWLVPFFDEQFAASMAAWTTRAGGFLLGRKTYDIFAASWPSATDPNDVTAAALNSRPKYVASTTLKQLAWHNAHLLTGDVAKAVAQLKDQPGGELQVHGSGRLLQTLLQHSLVDVLRIWQFPVLVGSGKRLFEPGVTAQAFRLTEREQTSTGAVLHVYERTGALKYGVVEVGQETVVFD